MSWLSESLHRIADDVAVEFTVSAHHLGTGARFDVNAGTPWTAGSTYKLVLAAVWLEAVAEGRADPLRRVRIDGNSRRDGPTGLSLAEDPVDISYRDLVRSMLTVSDNTAAHWLWNDLRMEYIQDKLTSWGSDDTRIIDSSRDDVSYEDLVSANDPWLNEYELFTSDGTDLQLFSVTTAADLRNILERIWTDRLATPQLCAWLRRVLGQQLFRHRLASGFDYDGVEVAGKTGTWGPYRHEAGVVTHPGEPPVVISVLTRSARIAQTQPLAHAAVGQIAATIVQAMRQGWRGEIQPVFGTEHSRA